MIDRIRDVKRRLLKLQEQLAKTPITNRETRAQLQREINDLTAEMREVYGGKAAGNEQQQR
jgi:hypothetical protein